eukprot:1158062-Pelagomonas_calceolata.AAC.5
MSEGMTMGQGKPHVHAMWLLAADSCSAQTEALRYRMQRPVDDWFSAIGQPWHSEMMEPVVQVCAVDSARLSDVEWKQWQVCVRLTVQGCLMLRPDSGRCAWLTVQGCLMLRPDSGRCAWLTVQGCLMLKADSGRCAQLTVQGCLMLRPDSG